MKHFLKDIFMYFCRLLAHWLCTFVEKKKYKYLLQEDNMVAKEIEGILGTKRFTWIPVHSSSFDDLQAKVGLEVVKLVSNNHRAKKIEHLCSKSVPNLGVYWTICRLDLINRKSKYFVIYGEVDQNDE